MADEIVVRIRAEGQQQFIKDMKKAGVTVEDTGDKVVDSNKKMGKSFAGLGKIIGGAFAVATIIQFTKVLAKAAVDIDATNAKIQKVFGESSKAIERFARQNAVSLGLTVNEYKKAAAAIGDLLIPIGFQRKEAAALSNDLVKLSGALAAWTGGQLNASEVSVILTKALLGEREQLKTLGIQISEADVKSRLLEKGQAKLTGTALAQAKATATLELITQKSADAQAAFADETTTLAEAQGELSAGVRDIRDNLAQLLIPALADLVTALNNGLKAYRAFRDELTGQLARDAEIEEFSSRIETFTEKRQFDLERLGVTLEKNRLIAKQARAEGRDPRSAARLEKEIQLEEDKLQLLAAGERIFTGGGGIIEQQERTLKFLKEQLKEQQEIVNTTKLYSAEQVEANNKVNALKAEIKAVQDFLNANNKLAFEFNNLLGDIESSMRSVAGRTKDIDLNNVVQQIEQVTKGILLANDSVIEGGDLALEAYKKVKAEEVDVAAKTEDEKRQLAAISLSGIASFAGEISNFRNALAEQELQALQNKLDQGLISEKEFEKEKAEIQRKQAERQKQNAIFTAIVNGAAGIVSQFQAGPAGIALAAVVAALTAAQIAVIAAQPIPQFAKGTEFVKGDGHPNGIDTVPAYLTKGERVITVEKNKKYWDVLNAVHEDSPDKLMSAIAKMGIPVQFKSTYEELYKPMTAPSEVKAVANELGIDLNPLLYSNDQSRRTLGKKLDKIYMALIAQQGHRMTKA